MILCCPFLTPPLLLPGSAWMITFLLYILIEGLNNASRVPFL